MSITSLRTLCLNIVVQETLWRASDLPNALLKLAQRAVELDTEYKSCNSYKYKQDLNMAKIPYYQVIESILKRIMMSDNLPIKLKVKIAMNSIHLERDITESVLQLVKMLRHKTVENILYCISKVTISDGKVDRCETVLQILHDSYFELDLHTADIGSFCCLTGSMLEGVARLIVTCNRQRLNKRVADMSDYIEEIFEVWKTEAMLTVDENWDTTTYDGKLVFEHVSLNAPVDVLEYFLKRMKKTRRPFNVSSALISTLLCDDDRQEMNILYLLNNVGDRIRYRLFVRYHENIYRKLFMGYHSDYCLDVYKQLYRHGKLQACRTLLCLSIQLLCAPVCRYNYESIVYSNSKEIFLNMWYATSDLVKATLGTEFYKMLDMLIKKIDFHLVSTLINDKAYTSEQRLNFQVYVLSKLLLESRCPQELMRESPDITVARLRADMSVTLLKKILSTKCESYCFESLSILFESKLSECQLKHAVQEDKTFVIEAMSTVAQSGSGAEDLKSFLKWIFDDDNKAIKGFIQNNLLSDGWLVDVYKKYLAESSERGVCPTPFLFESLDVCENIEHDIKHIVRNDKEFMHKLCETFTSPQLCDVTKLLKCLFNDKQHKEKEEFLENFLLSERGLAHIYKLFECEYYNERLYLKYGFLEKVRHYFDILQYWFECRPRLVEAVGDALDRRGHPNASPGGAGPSRRVLLVPCESARERRVITDANYRMFRCVIRLELHLCLYKVESDVEGGIRGSLTRYVTRFSMRWASHRDEPVVL